MPSRGFLPLIFGGIPSVAVGLGGRERAKLGLVRSGFETGKLRKARSSKRPQTAFVGRFSLLIRACPIHFACRAASRGCAVPFSRVFRQVCRGHFLPSRELAKKKRMPPPEKLGMSCVPSAFPARWQEAGLRKFFCRCLLPSAGSLRQMGRESRVFGRRQEAGTILFGFWPYLADSDINILW